MGAQGNPIDPTQLALQVVQLKGSVDGVKETLSGVQSSLDAISAEQREARQSMIEIIRHQATQESHNEGLSRAFKAIERLSNELGALGEHVTLFKGTLRGAALLISIICILSGALVSTILYGYRSDVRHLNETIDRNKEMRDLQMQEIRVRLERLEARFGE